MPVHCPNCGTRIPAEGKFCNACGLTIVENEASIKKDQGEHLEASLLREGLFPSDISEYREHWLRLSVEIENTISHISTLPHNDYAEQDSVTNLNRTFDACYKQLDELVARHIQDIRVSLFRALLLQLEGSFAFTMVQRADFEKGRCERAIRAYERSFAIFTAPQQQVHLTPEITKRFPRSYLELGIAYSSVRRMQEAIVALERAATSGDAQIKALATELLPKVRRSAQASNAFDAAVRKRSSRKAGCIGLALGFVLLGLIIGTLVI
jgi:tetratricopeptide (TPR) repeat protein